MLVLGAHRKLLAWQEAMALAESVYRHCNEFPKHEARGLAAQLRRSAISVPSNIAEGAARNSSREPLQFLGVAIGSLAELETQLELAERLRYVGDATDVRYRLNRVARLLIGLRKSIKKRIGGRP